MALSCSRKTIYIIKREEYLLTTMVIFIVSIAFILLQQKKTNFNHMEAYIKIIEFCYIVMPSEYTKILEFNQYQKSDKAPFIIYADLECMIENIDGCKNIPKNLSKTKVSKHIPSGFSMSIIRSFTSVENKHVVFRVKGCMKTFCELFIEHAMKTINFKKTVAINIRAEGITRKCKNLLYLSRKT